MFPMSFRYPLATTVSVEKSSVSLTASKSKIIGCFFDANVKISFSLVKLLKFYIMCVYLA